MRHPYCDAALFHPEDCLDPFAGALGFERPANRARVCRRRGISLVLQAGEGRSHTALDPSRGTAQHGPRRQVSVSSLPRRCAEVGGGAQGARAPAVRRPPAGVQRGVEHSRVPGNSGARAGALPAIATYPYGESLANTEMIWDYKRVFPEGTNDPLPNK